MCHMPSSYVLEVVLELLSEVRVLSVVGSTVVNVVIGIVEDDVPLPPGMTVV